MNNETILEFHGGLHMIGGTVVSIEHGGKRVIFDFGDVLHPDADVVDERMILRKRRVVHDFLRLGKIPEIDGVYAREDLKGMDRLTAIEEDDRETAIFISHLHLDHMFGMGLVARDIPVLMTEEANELYACLDTIGEGVQGGEGRRFQSCRFGEAVKQGDIEVTPLKLDHDTLGACGLHISTPDGNIIYSGDLRRHGAHPEWTEAFIQTAKDKEPDILIMEGTTLRAEESQPDEEIVAMKEIPDMLTEKKIPGIIEEKLKRSDGLIVFNIYHRNIDRISGMVDAAVAAGRKPILEMETAHLADRLTNKRNFLLFERDGFLDDKEAIPEWKQHLLDKYEIVNAAKINEKPGDYFLQNSYHNLLELLDLRTEKGLYIHSNGIPLGDYDPGYEKLQKFLKRMDISFVRIGTSGHAIAKHLKYIVDEINPKVLVPLHSFHPHRLKPKDGEQLLPQYGERYRLRNGEMERIQ